MSRITLLCVVLALSSTPVQALDRVSQLDENATAPDCATFLVEFSPLVDWVCLGEADVLAPVPSGGDGARDAWKLRTVWIVASLDVDTAQVYYKLFIDLQTHRAIYRLSYDDDGRVESAVWLSAR